MSTCFLARHVRSSAVGGSMEGPEVRTRLPINDAWLDSIGVANLDEKKRPREEGGERRRRGKRSHDQALGCTGHVRLMAKRRYTMAYVSNHIKQ